MANRNSTYTMSAASNLDVEGAQRRVLKAEWHLAAYEFALGAVLVGLLAWVGLMIGAT